MILVVVSWLIRIGFNFYGGALVGRCYEQRRREARSAPKAPRPDA